MLCHSVHSTLPGVSQLTVRVAVQLFLTPVHVIWLCRRHHPCCLLGDQHGRTLLHSELQPPLKLIQTLTMTLAVFAAMILISISLRVRASAGAVGALTCPLRLFWDLTRLMRTSVLHVAATIRVPRRFQHALRQSLSCATRVLCTTHQVRRFGVRNRATRIMTRSAHLPGTGLMCHLVKLRRPLQLYQN